MAVRSLLIGLTAAALWFSLNLVACGLKVATEPSQPKTDQAAPPSTDDFTVSTGEVVIFQQTWVHPYLVATSLIVLLGASAVAYARLRRQTARHQARPGSPRSPA